MRGANNPNNPSPSGVAMTNDLLELDLIRVAKLSLGGFTLLSSLVLLFV